MAKRTGFTPGKDKLDDGTEYRNKRLKNSTAKKRSQWKPRKPLTKKQLPEPSHGRPPEKIIHNSFTNTEAAEAKSRQRQQDQKEIESDLWASHSYWRETVIKEVRLGHRNLGKDDPKWLAEAKHKHGVADRSGPKAKQDPLTEEDHVYYGRGRLSSIPVRKWPKAPNHYIPPELSEETKEKFNDDEFLFILPNGTIDRSAHTHNERLWKRDTIRIPLADKPLKTKEPKVRVVDLSKRRRWNDITRKGKFQEDDQGAFTKTYCRP